MIDLSTYRYHPVIPLPPDYEVYDFTQNYDPGRSRSSPYGIGKYNEKRRNMYTEPLFGNGSEARDIHMGIDIAAPVNTPVHAFYNGEIFLLGNNAQPGDYGYTLITCHFFDGRALFALHGHLSARSIEGKSPGQKFAAGEIIAFVGAPHENGGWNPHLHFQLSWEEPRVCDMPGVVSEAHREQALRIYPDPRLVLGPLY
jgi:murein DD-endopeptidase MepM/ murein hydrolase activator NlpD